jgi:alanyl-tRNA synthetase
MQFEQLTKEKRVPLPRPSIDTGMGLGGWPRSCRASTTITTSI